MIKVSLDKAQINKIEKRCMKSLEKLANEIVKDAPIPTDTENMKDNISIKKSGKTITIIHNAPYSARQYFHPEYNHDDDGTAEWYKEYLNGAKSKFLIDLFIKNY